MPPRKRATAPADAQVPLARLPDPSVATSSTFGVTQPAPPPPLSPTDERRERELEDVLAELGSDGRITVYHVLEGKATYAGQMTMDSFSLDTLLDTFGGGDKTLVFYQGRNKMDTVRVSLDPSIPPRNPKQGRLAQAAAPAQGNGADMVAMFAQMATMQMQGMQQTQQMMTGMVTAMVSMMTARPEKDPTDVALRIAEILKKGDSGGASPETLFSIFEKGMNVATKLGGGDDDGTLGVVKEGLGIVGKIVEANANAQNQRRIPASAPAAVALPAPAPSNGRADGLLPDSQAMNTNEPQPRPWVRVALPAAPLLLMMIGNVTPQTAASAIGDRLPEAEFNDLLTDIESGTVDEFIGRFERYFNAPLQSEDLRVWMRSLIAEVQAMVEPDDAEAQAPVA